MPQASAFIQRNGAGRSSRAATENLQQFIELASPIAAAPRCDRLFHAMRDMVSQDFVFDPLQRRTNRTDLGDDIDAIALVLDHALQTAGLALDPGQAFQQCRFVLVRGCHG